MSNRTTKGQTLLPSGNSLDKSSSIKPELEKHKVDDVVTVDKKHRDNNNDIQGPEDRNSNCYNNAQRLCPDRGKKGETYDQIIERLLQIYDKSLETYRRN